MKRRPKHAAPSWWDLSSKSPKAPPRHAAPSYRIKRQGPRKLSRIIVLCIAASYFLVVVLATIYSLSAYQEQLPKVRLLPFDSGRIPKASLLENPDGDNIIYMVEQQDGPWGKRYVVKEMSVYNVDEFDDHTVFVYDLLNSERAVVNVEQGQILQDGMEVSIIK